MIYLKTKPSCDLRGLIEENCKIGSIGHSVITHQIALQPGKFKVGDEFEWEGTLTGKVKITQGHLDEGEAYMIELYMR